ncbi:MAG: hypothetical protein AAGJ72_12260 [Pseudomonadota bacterium]
MNEADLLEDAKSIAHSILPECTESEGVALLLSYFYGKARTALIMNIKPNSVKVYKHRARRRLKEINKTCDIEGLLISRIYRNLL